MVTLHVPQYITEWYGDSIVAEFFHFLTANHTNLPYSYMVNTVYKNGCEAGFDMHFRFLSLADEIQFQLTYSCDELTKIFEAWVQTKEKEFI